MVSDMVGGMISAMLGGTVRGIVSGRRPPHKRFLVGCSPPFFMRLAEHLTALQAWCKKAMSAWPAKNPTCSVPAL